ncbi:MAG TPA: DUF4174 domain-containing protein [Paracoccus sp. (in: a-proteobacteria)]|nr:DUF4174 domain-containing protein [Paracoccus sp. (in: a-proteobacteria)]
MKKLRSIWMAAGLSAALAGHAAGMGASTPPPGPVALPQGRPEASAPAPVAPAAVHELEVLEAAEVTPESLLFEARPVIVFADTAADPSFVTQLALLERDPVALQARDAVVIVDTDPAAASVWRRQLRPRGFSLVVLDKQGNVIDRKPVPWDTREIGRAIDKTPERRAEMARARGGR